MRYALATAAALAALILLWPAAQRLPAYPSSPLHGGRSCLDCHKAQGPWQGTGLMVLDLLDAATDRSYAAGDHQFTIPFAPGEEKALVALLGVRGIAETFPRLASWAFLDDALVKTASPASPKLPAGWQINRLYGFSYLDDHHDAYPGARLALVPFAVRAGPGAQEAVVTLHVLVQGDRDASGAQTAYETAVVRLTVAAPPALPPVEHGAAPPARRLEEVARLGVEIFREKKCGACHQLAGVGGTTGPDLTHIGAARSRQWLEEYLRNPRSKYPQSYVRPIELSDDKLSILLDFLESRR